MVARKVVERGASVQRPELNAQPYVSVMEIVLIEIDNEFIMIDKLCCVFATCIL